MAPLAIPRAERNTMFSWFYLVWIKHWLSGISYQNPLVQTGASGATCVRDSRRTLGILTDRTCHYRLYQSDWNCNHLGCLIVIGGDEFVAPAAETLSALGIYNHGKHSMLARPGHSKSGNGRSQLIGFQKVSYRYMYIAKQRWITVWMYFLIQVIADQRPLWIHSLLNL